RDGFEDWIRADAVPELRPFFKKKIGTPIPATKAVPKREVPRPTDGKLAGKKPTPAVGLAIGGGARIEEKKATPKVDVGEESLPDLSDSLELDDADSGERDTVASTDEPLGESVADAVSGLFGKAESGKVSDLPKMEFDEHPENGAAVDGELELSISEPSRIVK